jgi:RHS repeat-associated protein
VSAVLAIASPRRIKASHRRRRKIAAGHFVQRYYDPAIGRFLSTDPVGTDPNTGANFNRHSYANNNPYRFKDVDGRWPTKIHEKIIDKAFPGLSEKQRTVLKIASRTRDQGPLSQTKSHNHEHAMKSPGEDAGKAKEGAQQSIATEVKLARELQGGTPSSVDKITTASLLEVGNGVHTATDGTSPAHVDSSGNPRDWNGIPTSRAEVRAIFQHEAEEATISNSQMNNAVFAARQVFSDAYGPELYDQATGSQ